ncbi:MAG: four helix bundle protein [Bacteroidia bacterium]
MRPHKNLILWQESVNLAEEIYTLTNKFPDAERFGIVSQLRRAAISISANISAGAARSSKKTFQDFSISLRVQSVESKHC